MAGTQFNIKGTGPRQRFTARCASANQQQPAPHALRETVARKNVEEVELEEGVWYVRSNFSPLRSYPVTQDDLGLHCGCTAHRDQRPCPNIKKINKYIAQLA